jgi:hypothetical protein
VRKLLLVPVFFSFSLGRAGRNESGTEWSVLLREERRSDDDEEEDVCKLTCHDPSSCSALISDGILQECCPLGRLGRNLSLRSRKRRKFSPSLSLPFHSRSYPYSFTRNHLALFTFPSSAPASSFPQQPLSLSPSSPPPRSSTSTRPQHSSPASLPPAGSSTTRSSRRPRTLCVI